MKYHSYWQCTHITTEGPGLRTRLRWVKPGLYQRKNCSCQSLLYGQMDPCYMPACPPPQDSLWQVHNNGHSNTDIKIPFYNKDLSSVILIKRDTAIVILTRAFCCHTKMSFKCQFRPVRLKTTSSCHTNKEIIPVILNGVISRNYVSMPDQGLS